MIASAKFDHSCLTDAAIERIARGVVGQPLKHALALLLAGPLRYWSEGVLMSPKVRRCWVEPDRETIPW